MAWATIWRCAALKIFFGVGRIRHEAALNEDARHVELAKDQELSATNAAVIEIGFFVERIYELDGQGIC